MLKVFKKILEKFNKNLKLIKSSRKSNLALKTFVFGERRSPGPPEAATVTQ